jgi:hypothetical protein
VWGTLSNGKSAIIREVENSPIHVDAVIDPLSSAGQKITPFLVLLQDWIQPSMRIILNPMASTFFSLHKKQLCVFPSFLPHHCCKQDL